MKTEDWHLPAAPRPSAELEAALEELKRAGREAGAFLVLVADHIRSEAKTNDGWQPMQIPQFGEGIMDLAHGLISDFWSNLEKFIASETGEKLEAATGALGHGLRMMADIYSERGLSGGFAFYTGIRLNEKLHTAFDRAFKASCEARKAVAS